MTNFQSVRFQSVVLKNFYFFRFQPFIRYYGIFVINLNFMFIMMLHDCKRKVATLSLGMSCIICEHHSGSC